MELAEEKSWFEELIQDKITANRLAVLIQKEFRDFDLSWLIPILSKFIKIYGVNIVSTAVLDIMFIKVDSKESFIKLLQYFCKKQAREILEQKDMVLPEIKVKEPKRYKTLKFDGRLFND